MSNSSVKWNLGPSWLVEGELPEEMIFIAANLGSRYAANFQDALGQFQTNQTSTLLNLRVDSNKKKPSSTSPLVLAIQEKGSAVLSESKIYFALSALNAVRLDDDHASAIPLSPSERKSVAEATSKGTVIVNSAPLRTDGAPHGIFALEGEPAIARPQGIDVGIANLGGMSVALRLVSLAKAESQLLNSVKLFVALVADSWRNSEDAERIQGYEILALHIRRHASLITPAVHDALFQFVGYNFEDPSKSIVSNPLACRFLLLDLGLWGLTGSVIQHAHFARLREFVDAENMSRDFNLRRMLKMR